jgi:hypothetical protein
VPSLVDHAPARLNARLLTHMPHHPMHILRPFKPTQSGLFPQRALHTHRFVPVPHLALDQPICAVPRCARASIRMWRGHRRGGAVIPVRYLLYVRTRATLWLRTLPQRAYIQFDMLPRQFCLHTQLHLPSSNCSRVSRIFQDAAVSRPELQWIIVRGGRD